MNCTPGKLRLLFVLCAIVGVAGLAVGQTQRFLALRIEQAVRELGDGQAKVGAVTGSLLEGLSVRNLEFAVDRPGETRLSLKLPELRAVYDLPSALLRARSTAPASLQLLGLAVEIERRGPKVELHKLVRLLELLRDELPETPLTVTRGTLLLSGDFPWKEPQRISIEEAFLEWSGIGLACRTTLVWQGLRLTCNGSYDPLTGLGHWRWEGRQTLDRLPLALASSSPLPPPLLGATLTGELLASGELFLRTQPPEGPGDQQRWLPVRLDRVAPFYLAWDSSASISRGQLDLPWDREPPLPVETAKLSWPSGSAGSLEATVGVYAGKIALAGKVDWPAAALSGLRLTFTNLRPPLLATQPPDARVSGELELNSRGRYPFRARLSHLLLPRVPAPATADLAGTISTSTVDLTEARIGAGRATATGTGRLQLPGLAYDIQAQLQDLPAEWLGQAAGVAKVTGKGLRGTLEARGSLSSGLAPEGHFTAHAQALAVAGMSAGDIRATGRFSGERIEIETLEGLGSAQLFKSIRLSGTLIPGKMPELTGHVRGLRLEAFASGVKGIGDADVRLTAGRHEIHATIRDFAVPALELKLPQADLRLVPRGKSETLELSLPGKGRIEASVVWGAANSRALQAAGSFRFPDVKFLLAGGGFLRGGRAGGSFRLNVTPQAPPEIEFSLVELNLDTQRGPLVADGVVSGKLKEGRLVFSPSKILLAGGSIGFEGVAGMSDRNWDFKLDTANLPIHLPAIFGSGNLSGRLFSSFQLSGTLSRPTVVATVDLAQPTVGAQARPAKRVLERVRGRLVYRSGDLSVDRLTLAHGKQECVLSGRVPVTLSLVPFSAAWGAGAMDLRLVFPKTPLSVASLLIPWIPAAAEGSFQADVSLSGTPSAPRVQGLLEANASRILLPGLGLPLTAATARVVFSDDKAEIRQFEGRLAGAKLEGTGGGTFQDGWKLQGGMDLTLSELKIAQRNLNLDGVMVRGRLDVRPGRLDLESSFTVEKGVLDLAFFDGTGAGSFFDSLPVWFGYRIAGTTRGNFWVRSNAVNAELEGGIELKGKGAERTFGGELNAVRGKLLFQGHRFNVEQGTVSFRTPALADPALFPWQSRPREERRPGSVPYINARGTQEIGKTIITMEVNGPAEQMNFALRSLPPHTEEEILAILATGNDSEVASATGQEDLVGKMIRAPLAQRFDEQFLNRPVGAAVRKATGLDEFRIDSNLLRSDKSTNVTPQISAGKYLSKDLFLSVDGRVGGESQPLERFGLQYKLEKNLAFTLDRSLETKTINEDLTRSLRPEETKVGMEYRLRW